MVSEPLEPEDERIDQAASEVRRRAIPPMPAELAATIVARMEVAAEERRWGLSFQGKWRLAAAAILLVTALAVALWIKGGDKVHPNVALAAGWRVEPTGMVEYQIVTPERIRLERGELLVESTALAAPSDARPTLTIETPGAIATASGTRFYIGCHQIVKGSDMKSTRLTRVLVLSGLVTLASHGGSITGGANTLLAAEPGAAPTKAAVQANSDFAFDMYAQFAKENPEKNIFFSPYSVSSALAMVAEGARGETALEMGKVLRFPAAARRAGGDAQLIPWQTSLIHTGMADLNNRLTGEKEKAAREAMRTELAKLHQDFDAAKQKTDELKKAGKWAEFGEAARVQNALADKINALRLKVEPYELRIANALWGEKTYPFSDDYVRVVDKYYQTGHVRAADFLHDFPAERTKINQWVEDQTSGRIKDIVPQLPPEEARLVRLILANAVYFKGEWLEPFKEAQTAEGAFTLGDGKTIKTPIMHAQDLDVANYGAFSADGSFFQTPQKISRTKSDEKGLYPEDGFAIAELPYKGDDLSMVLIAPLAPDGLPKIEKKLSAADVGAWIGKLEKRRVHVLLPKFKLETDYEMGKSLQSMGMVRAFTPPPGGADLSGMSASKDPATQLYISNVLHKAFLEVNEKGTEAAAATVVITKGAAAEPAEPNAVPFVPTFKADRPFLLLIRDIKTGSILFMGRVMDPRP